MAVGRPGGKGEWCPELEALTEHPHLMLLAAVVMRARWDEREHQDAREFMALVQANAREGMGPEGVLLAMQGMDAEQRPARKRVVGIWW